ncbi:MAG: 4Fe-4S binding protein [Promethearchaeota archaeon]
MNDMDCIGCGNCLNSCPMQAIELKDDLASVIKEKCIGCGICAQHCPQEAIKLKRTGLRRVFLPAPIKNS